LTNAQIATELAKRAEEQAWKAAGKGLEAAGIFLTARVRETLNVPAPKHGSKYLPAVYGAPPRKRTGHLLKSVAGKLVDKQTYVIVANARAKKGFQYGKYHELNTGGKSGRHPFIRPTFVKWRAEVMRIIGSEFSTEFR
jgi:hypothetical protein